MSTRRNANKDKKRQRRQPPEVHRVNFDLYRWLFDRDGDRKMAALLLCHALRISKFPRLKDGWVEKVADGGAAIVLYARAGSRYQTCSCTSEDHAEGEDIFYGACLAPRLREVLTHPNFLRSEDDAYDPTYAKFYYRIPPQARELLEPKATEPVDTAARWSTALAAHELDPSPEVPEQLRDLISQFSTRNTQA